MKASFFSQPTRTWPLGTGFTPGSPPCAAPEPPSPRASKTPAGAAAEMRLPCVDSLPAACRGAVTYAKRVTRPLWRCADSGTSQQWGHGSTATTAENEMEMGHYSQETD